MNEKKETMLSKSRFLNGLQCQKYLYLYKHHPELMDEIPASTEALFQSGTEVGKVAQKLFPGGVEIPFEGLSYSDQIKRTLSEIEKETTTIYEATFSYNGVFARVDILHKGKDGWELYEVKSSTEVKDVYMDDVAVQYHILNGLELPVSKAYLVHINNDYVRKGEIEVKKLFAIEDFTDTAIEKQDFIKEEIKKQKEMLKGDMPEIDIGKYCESPYDCRFIGYCWQHIPEDSIFSLRDKGVNKFELYKQGIIHLRDVPRNIVKGNQKIQLEVFLEKKNGINKDSLKEFLDSLWHPMCFFDFETTYMVPLPMFDGTRPYQQVPFQFSLHYLEKENSELKHYEYLAPANADPREELIKNMLAEIPENGCVLVYNKNFEKRILNYLKAWFPEYSGQLDNIINNLRDLMIPFKNKDIYCWQFNGSYSLKSVLPVLVPELSYEEMEVSDGAMASDTWINLWKMDDPQKTERTRKALLEYCKLDTLAMVRIVEKLKELI